MGAHACKLRARVGCRCVEREREGDRFRAAHAPPFGVQAVAVVGVAPDPVTPCGGCRQKLREFAAADCPVWVADMDRVRARFTLAELLPASFGPEHLKR